MSHGHRWRSVSSKLRVSLRTRCLSKSSITDQKSFLTPSYTSLRQNYLSMGKTSQSTGSCKSLTLSWKQSSHVVSLYSNFFFDTIYYFYESINSMCDPHTVTCPTQCGTSQTLDMVILCSDQLEIPGVSEHNSFLKIGLDCFVLTWTVTEPWQSVRWVLCLHHRVSYW